MSDRATRAVGDVDRVLVVGDTDRLEDVAVSLTRAFDAATLIRERSADGALARLETADGGIDCLVCGVGSSGDGDADEDGDFETVTRLAAALPETPILAVLEGDFDGAGHRREQSNRRGRDDATRALEAGATDVLRGDESPAVVVARVRNAAGSRGDAGRQGDRAGDQRRAESLLAHAAAVVCVLEPDGTIDAVSPAVESRFGRTPDELEGRPLSRFVHPDDRSRLTATITDVASGPVGTTDELAVRLRRSDGAWVHTGLTVGNRLGDPTVDALVVTITAGETTAHAAGTENHVETALDRLERPVFAVGPDDDLRYWNEAATTLFEAAPERGVLVWSVLPESFRHDLAERAGQARTTDDSVAFRSAAPSADGHLEVTVLPGAEGLTVLVDRAKPSDAGDASPAASPDPDALERDREERDLLESTVDALEDGILVLEDGRVQFANATVSRLAGGDPIVGREVDELFDADLAAAVADRAGSTVVRWMDPLAGTLAVGDRRPAIEVFVAPLPATERTLCVVRERRRSAESALGVLDRTIADVHAATSRPAIREAVLEGVLEWATADAAGWYAVEGDRLEPLALETAAEHDDVARRALEPDDQLLADLTDREPGGVAEEPSLVPALTRTGIRTERVLTVSLGAAGVVLVAGPDPLGVERIERTALSALAGAATLAIERLESGQDLQTCRRARSRAETVADREIRVQALERALLAADTLETLERRLCDGLLAIEGATEGGDSLAVAWVGRVDDRTGTVDPVAWAGTGADDKLGGASFPIDADAPDPASRVAAREGGPIVVDLERVAGEEAGASALDDDSGGAGADSGPGPGTDEITRWHRSLRERGLRWAVSVSIEYDGIRYGTLTAYVAESAAAVDERARSRLRHLGTIAGFAIGALRRTTLAEGVTELEVALRDGDPLTAVAAELDRRLDLRAVVPRPSGGATVYCVSSGVDADALERVVERVDAVSAARTLGAGDDEGANAEASDGFDGADDSGGAAGERGENPDDRTDGSRRVGVELRLTTRPLTEAVANHGGTVRAVVPDGDRTRLFLEVPATASVRSVIQRLEREYAGVELLARRERDRSPQFWQPFETRLQTRLSDRQRRTLEAAYHGGFFEWPRERTGEDVAAALGVSQPTFSRHLRSAQRNLLSLLFENEFDDDE